MLNNNQKSSLIKKIILEVLFLAALLVVDLVSKTLVFKFLEDEPGKQYVIWDDIFTFIQAKNYGASFGIFTGEKTFLIVLTSIVLVGVLVFLYVKPNTNKTLRIGLLMIVGGGLGNLIDRAYLGYVRDFIDYTFLDTFFGINFAIGNVADIFLLVGTLVLIVYVVFDLQKEMTEKEKKSIENQDNTTDKTTVDTYEESSND